MIQFTTAQAIATHLRLSGGQPDAAAVDAAAAVNSLLQGWDDLLEDNPDPDAVEQLVPTPAAQLGATMLGARLHRRRATPNGIEAIDGSVASYVARTDPDVARLLRIDAHTPPAVG